jgi:hypothetical protein
LAIWYFGDLSVNSSQKNAFDNTEFEKSLNFQVIAKDGLNGVVEGSWCKKGYRLPEIGLNIIGSDGTINVNDDEVSLNDKTSGGSKKWYRLSLNDNVGFLLGAPEYYRESKAFIDV